MSCVIEGHRYEPRYDLGPVVLPKDLFQIEALSSSLSGRISSDILDKFRSKTYVRDICPRCGVTTDRKHGT